MGGPAGSKQLMVSVLMSTWNILSAPMFLCIHYSSLEPMQAEGISRGGLLAACIVISIASAATVACVWWWVCTHAVTQKVQTQNEEVSPSLASQVWKSVCMGYEVFTTGLEISLILVLSQEVTRSRKSPMYINMEYAYILPVLCILLTLPRIMFKNYQHENTQKITAIPYTYVVMSGTITYIIFLASNPGTGNQSKNLEAWQTIASFAVLTTILMIPANVSIEQTSDRWFTIKTISISCSLKCVFTVVGILVLWAKYPSPPVEGAQGSNSLNLHDFYTLRYSLSQADRGDPANSWRVDPSPYRIIPGVILPAVLKFHFALAATCRFFNVVQSMQASNPETHEIKIILIILCITVAVVASSNYFQEDHHQHSIGPLWAFAGSLIVTAASTSILYLDAVTCNMARYLKAGDT